MDSKISIITVVLNKKKLIGRCLTSIFNQDYPLESIVIDGGSTDGTLEIIKSFNEKIAFFSSNKDTGIYDAINKGIKKSSGDIIGMLHSDDVFNSNSTIKNIASYFIKYPDIDVICGNVIYVNSNGKMVRIYDNKYFKLFSMRFGYMPAHTGTFFRRKVYEKYGLYDTSLKSASDFDFMLRTFYVNKIRYLLVNNTVTKMEIGGMSTSGFNSYLLTTNEIYLSLKKYKIFSNYLIILIRLPVKFLVNFYCVRKLKK
jgi:glycosyltransferase involved in cell wall biosynthesis